MRVSRRLVCSSASRGGGSGGSSASVLSVLWTELKKVVPLASFQATHIGKVMMGTDSSTPEEAAKERMHKEKLNSILAAQEVQRKKEYQQKLAAMPSWKDRLVSQLHDAIESVKATTSKKSGVVMLIQHCTASHAAEVAVEQGIDVKDVQIVLEQQTAAKGIAENATVVGYIDAPTASEEEVMVFARNLTKACPAAMTYEGHIEWRRGRPSDAGEGDSHNTKNDARTSPATRGNDGETTGMGSNGTISPGGPAEATTSASTADATQGVPLGTPGGQRMHDASTRAANHDETPQPSSSSGRDGDEDLSLRGAPGARRRFEHKDSKKKGNPFQLD